MASTGFINPGTVTEDTVTAGAGTDLLDAPIANIVSTVSDAIVNWSTGVRLSAYYYCDNLGLSVPSGATIDGIEVRINHYSEDSATDNLEFIRVSLVDDTATYRTTNKVSGGGGEWPTTDTSTTWGGATDTWGESAGFWTATKVNNAAFGAVIQIRTVGGGSGTTPDGQLRDLAINVHYTESSGYTLTADAGSFTLTGVAAALTRDYTLTASTASFTLTGTATGFARSKTLVADNASYTVTGIASNLVADRALTAATAAYTLTGTATGLVRDYTLTAATVSFTLTGIDTALTPTRSIAAATGSFTLTGNDTALQAARVLTASTASYTLTGNDTAFSLTKLLTAETGAFTLTGNAAALQAARSLTATTASFTLTGLDTGLAYGSILTADTASYTLTGVAAGLAAGRVLTATTASFTLSGIDAGLTYTPASGAYSMTADAASFTLTGNDTGLSYASSETAKGAYVNLVPTVRRKAGFRPEQPEVIKVTRRKKKALLEERVEEALEELNADMLARSMQAGARKRRNQNAVRALLFSM